MTNILVIDDEEEVLSLIRRALEKEAYCVKTVSNPVEIWKLDLMRMRIPAHDSMQDIRKYRIHFL